MNTKAKPTPALMAWVSWDQPKASKLEREAKQKARKAAKVAKREGRSNA